MYGLGHMADFDVAAEFFDEDRRLGIGTGLSQAIAGILIRRTAIGWNIGQALRTLPRLHHYNCIFATTDSTGLPLAFLKRLGCWQGPLVMASQGLTQCLEDKRWNWGFRLHRWSLDAVDHFVTYGWAERQELIERFAVAPGKIDWIPFGVDTDYFSGWSDNNQTQPNDIVLSVGRDRCRDFGILLDTARVLPHIPFRIITSPENLTELAIPPNVEVLYDLPIGEVSRQYAACRFVVLPVRDSAYSFATTTALEAMAMGKAVLISRTRAVGPADHGYGLVDGVHCRFVPVDDLAVFVRAVSELWSDPGMCSELGRQGKEQVSRLFPSSRLAERLAHIFKNVAAVKE